MREAVRPLGIEIDATQKPRRPRTPQPADGKPTEEPAKKSKAAAQAPHNPVRHVHFSNFIIQ